MKTRNFIIATIVAISFIFQIDTNAQTEKKSGAHYCSMKHSKSSVLKSSMLGPNSPLHTFDVLNYSMNIELMENFDDPYPHNFEGSIVIRFKVDSVLSSINLNAHNSTLEINDVGMAALSHSHSNDILTLNLDGFYSPGDVVEVSIDYTHLDIDDNAFYAGGGFVFTDCEPEGARKWYPCWDSPADKPRWEKVKSSPTTMKEKGQEG